ncbi:MAG: haloacid dehalogenase type II [Actinomycetota bacterium]|nr:haloacid dehalogenase type II [Actinomycetota bacterium]
MKYKAVVFDLYGTLVNTEGTMSACVSQYGEKGVELVTLWRRFQLEFSWLRSLTGDFKDFDQITTDALIYSVQLLGLEYDEEIIERITKSYLDLPAFEEVPTVLSRIKEKYETLILSNGTPSSISTVVSNAKVDRDINHLVSAAAEGIYKPSPKAYDQVFTFTSSSKEEIIFVSSNSWDINGASTYGFDTFWVNRRNAPFENLGARAKYIGRDLRDLETLLNH